MKPGDVVKPKRAKSIIAATIEEIKGIFARVSFVRYTKKNTTIRFAVFKIEDLEFTEPTH